MGGVNWGLGVMPDIGGTFVNALNQGRQQAQENALLQMRQQEMQQRQQQAQQEAEQRTQDRKRADLPMMGRLLKHARQGPQQWTQALGVARQYGIDLSQVPQEYTPAWADEQIALTEALSDPAKAEALTMAGKHATEFFGLQPGTPEHRQKAFEIWQADNAKPYVSGGETRLYVPKVGGPGQVVGGAPPAPAIEALRRGEGTPEQFDEMFGAGAAARAMGQGGGGGRVTSNFLDGF